MAIENANKKIDWSSLWTKEDWWAVWIGFFILLLGIGRWLPALPKIDKWADVTKSFPAGVGTVGSVAMLFVLILILTIIGIAFMRKSIRHYLAGFPVIFGLAFLAMWIGKFAVLSKWGLETVLWALILGLIVSNVWRIPEWLKTGAQTEFFIKIGLVLLGAEILFSTIVKGGAVAMAQALLVVLAVWFFAYWIARKLGLEETFASVMATGLSICGVSAAIAAGGAVKANPKHTSYVVSLILLVAMPMLIGMPFLAKAIGLSPAIAGAWIGGTIDTTGAVVAAGTIVDPKVGLQAASLVKMAQNVLIGFAAFFLAIWSTLTLERKPGVEKPEIIEIWYRFPKFILGFVLASVAFSLLVEPALGTKLTNDILALTKGFREWFFALTFVSIGLDTRFKDLAAVGRGKPAVAFIVAQVMNVLWTLLIVWLLWSGIFFSPPLK